MHGIARAQTMSARGRSPVVVVVFLSLASFLSRRRKRSGIFVRHACILAVILGSSAVVSIRKRFWPKWYTL